jgi:phage terminase large subunit
MATRRLEALPEITNINLANKVNPIYLPHLVTVHEKEVYYGGSGSGKSTFVGGQKLPLQLTMYEGRNLVCLRSQKSDCLASCWAEVYNGLDKLGLIGYWEIKQNPVHKMINRIYGNEILFEGLDNIEDIKSIKFTRKGSKVGDANVTDIWYEEVNAEPDKEVIEELVRRLRDPEIKCRLILTFNPVTRTHWLYDYVMRDLQLPGIDALILKTTYLDNKFLPPSYGEDLKRLQYTNPYAYQVYCLGDWGTTGQTVFDANQIQKRLDDLKVKYAHEPYTIGYFDYQTDANGMPLPDTYAFFETEKGKIKKYELPGLRTPYVLAVDTAGEGSDYYVGHIRNNITGAQVATFRDNKTPDMCVWQLYGLAKMYNNALVGPEVNFNSWIITAFQLLGYDNFYRRTTAADRTTQKTERKYGWVTGPHNRLSMLTELVRWTKTNMHLINDVETLNEMLLFTVQEKAKGLWWGAEPGAHDDNVMCAAVMLQVCGQQFCEMTAEIEEVTGYWTQGELNIAVKEGRMEQEAAMAYMQEHPERFKRYKQGVSRYAR